MDPFDEWAKSEAIEHACVQKYAERLVELGATWDTFRSSRKPEAIVHDLVQGGIPILAASDIVDVATAAAKQSQAPLGIFWDLENMPVPATSSGRDVSKRLKSILKPYGELDQFRGYASIGLNLISQQKRSDLQLSGCLLVDCPHNGRKEVADKMIIVDAMHFAMQNPGGATLCFVTGDVDYAYLLAVLQRYKQYRTIVISKGSLQSMLDVNCDMKMRWETDILQLRSAPPAWTTNTREELNLANATQTSSSSSTVNSSNDTDQRVENVFEPLTPDEEWIDDVEFLRTLLRRERGSSLTGVRKSLVGNLLRQSNPARFPQREAVKNFLSQVIDKGIVQEIGEGAFKEIYLPSDETTGMFPAISLSNQLPISIQDIPDRVKTIGQTRPYIVFIKWKFCPSGTTLPTNVFVQHKDAWGFLMFTTLTGAQRTVSDFPWLRNGILVDWRKTDCSPSILESSPSTSKAVGSTACILCRAVRTDVTMQSWGSSGDFACPECIAWKSVPVSEKNAAAAKVVEMLQFLADYDDIRVPESIVRRYLHLKDEMGCRSRKWAALWIKHAIELELVLQIKIPSNKAKHIFLASQLDQVSHSLPPEDIDTKKHEDHVLDMLWDNPGGFVSRLSINRSLQETFPESMDHPYYRGQVLLNGVQKKRFHVAKGAYGQFVGLTPEDADAGLQSLIPKNERKKDETSDESAISTEMHNDGGNDSQSSDDDDEDGLRAFVGSSRSL